MNLESHPYFKNKIEDNDALPNYRIYHFEHNTFFGSIWIPRIKNSEYEVNCDFFYEEEKEKGFRMHRTFEIDKAPQWFQQLYFGNQ